MMMIFAPAAHFGGVDKRRVTTDDRWAARKGHDSSTKEETDDTHRARRRRIRCSGLVNQGAASTMRRPRMHCRAARYAH